MKKQDTIFEIGMEVYDQVNYPNKKGEVVDVESFDDKDNFPVKVQFEDEYFCEYYTYYTLDGRIGLEHFPTLSTRPYEVKLEGFEQKPQKKI